MSGKPCLNCGNLMAKDDKFCSHCGQSVKEVTLSLSQILQDGFSNFINWDTRLFRTLRDIFKPYLLTKIYVEGRRRFYVSPARLFAFTLLSFFSIYFLTSGNEVNLDIENQFHDSAARIKLSSRFDTLSTQLFDPGLEPELDSLRTKLFGNVYSEDDTIAFELKDLNINLSSYAIKTRDIYLLPVNELIEKYKIEKFIEKLVVKQYIHFQKDASGVFRFVVKNFSYAAILLVILGALILKLLYIRQPYYYVEHLVLIFYSHTLVFLLLIPFVLCVWLDKHAENVALASFIFLLINQFITLKKYYRQGWRKTLFKQMVFNMGYVMALGFSIILISIISFILV